jgi:hypothetical protein
MPKSTRIKNDISDKVPNTVEEQPDESTSLINNNLASNEIKLVKQQQQQRDKIIEHSLLLNYKLPVLDIKRPKSMCNKTFNFDDVSDLRELKLSLANNCKKQINSVGNSHQFYDDLEFEAYFKNKNNWSNLAKFTNTSSFLATTQVYLPDVKIDKEIFTISNEFKEQQQQVKIEITHRHNLFD